jgi:hypothetical protein
MKHLLEENELDTELGPKDRVTRQQGLGGKNFLRLMVFPVGDLVVILGDGW